MNAEPASAPGFAPLDVRFPGSRDEQFEAFVADVGRAHLPHTESETAIELAVSVGTVKSHNARALARLRTLLMEGRQ